MQAEETYLVSTDVVSRIVAGEMVLLDLASGQYFGLNPVGTRVWERLNEGPCSIADLSRLIESEFEAPYEQIERDIIELARDLAGRELIRRV